MKDVSINPQNPESPNLPTMNTQIMLDLETLGQKPGSVIVAIGAVKFTKEIIGPSFYARIDPESCVALGMTMDVSTVLWWLRQSDEARAELAKPGEQLSAALCRFSEWTGAMGDVTCAIWGNGAGFDNALLADAYDRTKLPRPWSFWHDRCYRTVKNLHPEVKMNRSGTHHNALDDAMSQAKHLLEIFAYVDSHAENPA